MIAHIRTKLTYPNASFITYTYDQLNRLDLIKGQGGATLADVDSDALSRRTQLTLANNTTTTSAYDAVNRLLSLGHAATGPRSRPIPRRVYCL